MLYAAVAAAVICFVLWTLCDPCNVVYVIRVWWSICFWRVYEWRALFWRVAGRTGGMISILLPIIESLFFGVCGFFSCFFFNRFFHIENCCGSFVFLRILLFLSRSIWRDFWYETAGTVDATIQGAGLSNLGNTCFLNAVLQCLTYTPPLAGYLESGQHRANCKLLCFLLTLKLLWRVDFCTPNLMSLCLQFQM